MSSTVSTPITNSASIGRTLPFRVLLHGLSGSGKSACEAQLGLTPESVHTIDERFLTSPQIYSSTSLHPNRPTFARRTSFGANSVWRYGGRGTVSARWSLLLNKSKAQVFVVDSTDRARLAPHADFKPLPLDFVVGYDARSKEEQAEMLALLKSQMTAKSLFDALRKEISDYRRHPILVLATKQDIDGAMSVEEICDIFGLKSRTTIDWRVVGVDATTGEGFDEAVAWLKQVVQTPTKFNSSPTDETQIDDMVAWMKSTLLKFEKDYRWQRLDRGDVLPAPALYRSNGTIVKTDPKQAKEFVLTPLTPDTIESMTTLYERQVKHVALYAKESARHKERYEAIMPPPVHIQWQQQQEFFEKLKQQQEVEDIDMDPLESDDDSSAEDVASNASTVTGTPEASSESDAESGMDDIPEVQSPLLVNKKTFFEEKKFAGFEQHARLGVTAN